VIALLETSASFNQNTTANVFQIRVNTRLQTASPRTLLLSAVPRPTAAIQEQFVAKAAALNILLFKVVVFHISLSKAAHLRILLVFLSSSHYVQILQAIHAFLQGPH
jgi:hypothetical protein